ncbi:MAG: hypothetical protein MUC33_08820, partial [Desulfobacterales bacterium]|nr:hypothetical protein [Desulfobacterales bacterium]
FFNLRLPAHVHSSASRPTRGSLHESRRFYQVLAIQAAARNEKQAGQDFHNRDAPAPGVREGRWLIAYNSSK